MGTRTRGSGLRRPIGGESSGCGLRGWARHDGVSGDSLGVRRWIVGWTGRGRAIRGVGLGVSMSELTTEAFEQGSV